MSYIIVRKCEWCGKEHDEVKHEILTYSGSNCDLKLSDLCNGCYKKISRALKAQRDIIADKAITFTFNMWFGSLLAAAGLGALICFVITNA